MKKIIYLGLLVFIFGGVWGLFSGFQQKEVSLVKLTKQDLIEAAIQDKIRNFIKSHQKICKQNRLTDAALRVDSILIERAKLQRDTLSKPPKPEKPMRPTILNLEDTTPIAPILRAEKDPFFNKKNED